MSHLCLYIPPLLQVVVTGELGPGVANLIKSFEYSLKRTSVKNELKFR